MEEMKLIHKVENGELDMLGYIMLNPELKEPFSDYARGNGITCPTAADAVRFLKEYEESANYANENTAACAELVAKSFIRNCCHEREGTGKICGTDD